jgi:hypothetical protein
VYNERLDLIEIVDLIDALYLRDLIDLIDLTNRMCLHDLVDLTRYGWFN